MAASSQVSPPVSAVVLLLFNESNLALLRRAAAGDTWLATVQEQVAGGDVAAVAQAGLRAIAGDCTGVTRMAEVAGTALFFALAENCRGGTPPGAGEWGRFSLREMEALATNGGLAPELAAVLPAVREHSIAIPYLNHSENDYIYRFRSERQRNRAVYRFDPSAARLYQSALCEAIKRLKRTKERSSESPAELDFGAVRYVLPSHFGFCLGVQNAIERAYETIAENPGRRVFMLSELIHNPFVNEDLLARGLRFLQSDKGKPLTDPATGRPLWDELRRDDIVIIPAFGATDDDKRRLIERGIELNRHDATCMLVEKVWKAARRYGQLGYTVIIHGKHEHEETKATFSNSAKHAPSLIIRDVREAEQLGAVIAAPSPEEARRLFAAAFVGRHSDGFDPARDLARVAVVNQTTLLRNETLRIIDRLEQAYTARYGAEALAEHLCPDSRGDTLCYATQVNQDALSRALDLPLDAALVVGGKNSSNTFQLFRLCEQKLGGAAHYIQSERDIVSRAEVDHFVYPHQPGDSRGGRLERRAFLPARTPVRLLITGGASCPDGLIQQVVARVNAFHAPEALRPIELVLAELEAAR
ncbi:MAG TPA: 4-hydroxy-3-methylbut-2-enyl diphosphate reductase [Opitutaceae bacterium]|nr:4-hydroxy-3-methylbut-2-enyl diphosphate reductase [Opitutaceae bacterium]